MVFHDVELLRKEMMAAGNRLILALTAENEFGRIHPAGNREEIRKRWSECRAIVAQSADDYAEAINRWRTAVVAIHTRDCARRPPLLSQLQSIPDR